MNRTGINRRLEAVEAKLPEISWHSPDIVLSQTDIQFLVEMVLALWPHEDILRLSQADLNEFESLGRRCLPFQAEGKMSLRLCRQFMDHLRRGLHPQWRKVFDRVVQELGTNSELEARITRAAELFQQSETEENGGNIC